jgi:hypothetical protein
MQFGRADGRKSERDAKSESRLRIHQSAVRLAGNRKNDVPPLAIFSRLACKRSDNEDSFFMASESKLNRRRSMDVRLKLTQSWSVIE